MLRSYTPRNYLHRKLWSIVYPYFIWSGIFVAMKLMLSAQVNHQLGILDLFTIPYKPINYFWFLYALMLMHLASVVLRKKEVTLGVIAIAGFILVSNVPFLLPGVLRRTALNLPFFYFGLVIARRRVPISLSILCHPLVLLILACFFYVGGLKVYQNDILNQPMFMLPLTIAGIGLIIGISSLLAQTPFSNALSLVGRLSMVIFLIHVIFTAGIRITMKKIGVDGVLLNLIIGTLAGVISPIILNSMFMRVKMESWIGLSGKSPLRHI